LASRAQSSDTTSTKRIDKRQEKQQKRIDKGVESGQLNEKEAAIGALPVREHGPYRQQPDPGDRHAD